jgi:hypothetical protein
MTPLVQEQVFTIHLSYIWLQYKKKNETLWPKSASELYRQSDRHLPAKIVPTFADREWHGVSVTAHYGRILGFLDRSRYFFFQVAPQLYSRLENQFLF